MSENMSADIVGRLMMCMANAWQEGCCTLLAVRKNNIVSLDGGDNDLASNLAKHCVLELPDKTGKIPKVELKDDEVKNDEYRLLYQVISRKH